MTLAHPLRTIDEVVRTRLIDAGVQPAPVPAGSGTRVHAGLNIDRRIDRVVARSPEIIIGLADAKEPPPWTGFHRGADQTPVLMQVDVTWQDGNLRVVIHNRPEDRNYVAWLVVEEASAASNPTNKRPRSCTARSRSR